ncbi:MAG: hypothetical protein HOV80_21925 [Polyangiaceae bacterium]|nr:hypothetical protein [Polyangiaceae bacterium]
MSFWRRGVVALALSAGAAAVSPSCANTLDGDDDDGDGGEDGDGDGPGRSSCDDFQNASPSTIPVTWVNNRDITIYVWLPEKACELRPQFALYEDGNMTVQLDRQACVPTCGDYQEAPVACESTCPEPKMMRIEPGGQYTFDWVPVFYDFSQMPLECYHDDQPLDSQGYCDTKAPLEDKSYSVVGEYYFDTLVKAPGAGSMEYGCACANGSTDAVCEAVAGCSAEGGGATVDSDQNPQSAGAILIDVHI